MFDPFAGARVPQQQHQQHHDTPTGNTQQGMGGTQTPLGGLVLLMGRCAAPRPWGPGRRCGTGGRT